MRGTNQHFDGGQTKRPTLGRGENKLVAKFFVDKAPLKFLNVTLLNKFSYLIKDDGGDGGEKGDEAQGRGGGCRGTGGGGGGGGRG